MKSQDQSIPQACAALAASAVSQISSFADQQFSAVSRISSFANQQFQKKEPPPLQLLLNSGGSLSKR